MFFVENINNNFRTPTEDSVAILQVLDAHLDVLDGEVELELLQAQVGAAVASERLSAEVHLSFHTLCEQSISDEVKKTC